MLSGIGVTQSTTTLTSVTPTVTSFGTTVDSATRTLTGGSLIGAWRRFHRRRYPVKTNVATVVANRADVEADGLVAVFRIFTISDTNILRVVL